MAKIATRATAKPSNQPAAPYEPSATEKAAVERHKERRAKRRPPVRFKSHASEGGTARVEVDHTDAATGEAIFRDALGVADAYAASWIVELLGVLSIINGEQSPSILNRHFALVQEIAPNDATEALLACQMSAVHTTTMAVAGNALGSKGQARDASINQLNKLARTFAAQMEALKRYRSNGNQRVVVEHKHYYLAPGAVSPGSQAVIGDVSTQAGGRGAQGKTSALPHESLTPFANGHDAGARDPQPIGKEPT